MQVIKRDNTIEPVEFNKVSRRLQILAEGLAVDYIYVAQQVISRIVSGIHTRELDDIAANISANLVLRHPDYAKFAARIACSNARKNTPCTFSETMETLQSRVIPAMLEFVRANAEALNAAIDYTQNSHYPYMAQKMLESKYMQSIEKIEDDPVMPSWAKPGDVLARAYDGTPMILRDGVGYRLDQKYTSVLVDDPQHVLMRVAITARYPDLPAVIQVYRSLSRRLYTHATPTLFNSCMNICQLMSCFLLSGVESIEDIMQNVKDASVISKMSGGLGISRHNIRGSGAYIHGTGGISNGLIKQLDIYAELAATWNQGGRRPGAAAIYLEPWHRDIVEVLRRFLPHELDTLRGKLHLAMWIPDLFFEKFLADDVWCLFNDNTAPGLCDVYDGMEVCEKCDYCHNPSYSRVYRGVFVGHEGNPAAPIGDQRDCAHSWTRKKVFTEMYTRYAREGRARLVIPAGVIMDGIVKCLQLSGEPYILAKDVCNRLSNQSNLGTIKSSNLCTEIMEWSGTTSDGLADTPRQSYACCALTSINLPAFFTRVDAGIVEDAPRTRTILSRGYFDHEALRQAVHEIVINLDNILDANNYPVPECRENSIKYRPIGIGVQGLANLFLAARIPFDSPEAAALDLEIAETIYFAYLEQSTELARTRGPHVHSDSSPISRGKFHFEMWAEDHSYRGAALPTQPLVTPRWDWETLRAAIKANGLRNSLGVAYMPTVSTSQLLGNNESFEPFADIAYSKRTNSGSFLIVNEEFQRHLLELGLWNQRLKDEILLAGGDISKIASIPEDIKHLYRPVWEIRQKHIIDRAAARGRFIDQSQSLNIHLKNGARDNIISAIIAGWRQGLKTISYYMRTRTVETMKNIAQSTVGAGDSSANSDAVCTMSEGCVMCSS